MTPKQHAELTSYDEAVDAAPDQSAPYLERARFLERNDGDFAAIVADLRASLNAHPRNQEATSPRQHLERARENWRYLQSYRNLPEVKFWQAQAIASFLVALESSPATAAWLAARAPSWDALAVLQRAADDNFALDESENGEPSELQMWALAVALTCGGAHDTAAKNISAARLYQWALQAEAHLKAQPRDDATNKALASGRNNPDYQQLAGWNLCVEAAPEQVEIWRGRAQWKAKHDDFDGAVEDFGRAIALAPDDATLYEARAAANPARIWWEMAPDSVGAAADYARAFRLRIAAGEMSGAPDHLASEANKLVKRFRNKQMKRRAYALNSLALEGAPHVNYYFARAAALKAFAVVEDWWSADAKAPPEAAAAHLDYLRVLALDAHSEKARKAVIEHLIKTAQRPTSHERIEALLEARQQMLDFGVKPSLAHELIAKSERALAL